MSTIQEVLPHIAATLASGAVTAIQIAAGSLAIALAGGLLLALVVTFSRPKWVLLLVAAFVEWMRNVPALAHLFLLYFGLAAVDIRMSPISASVVGLGLVGAAVLCDVFAAGLKSIHTGQREAALAVGLTPRQALQSVLLPQMLRVTLPSLGNYASQLVKDTSIASAIAAPEVMFFARNLVTSTFETPLIYLTAILLYAAMVLPIMWLFARLEQRIGGRP